MQIRSGDNVNMAHGRKLRLRTRVDEQEELRKGTADGDEEMNKLEENFLCCALINYSHKEQKWAEKF